MQDNRASGCIDKQDTKDRGGDSQDLNSDLFFITGWEQYVSSMQEFLTTYINECKNNSKSMV